MPERSASDVCLQCGETRGAVKAERLYCVTGSTGEGGFEADHEYAHHRFAPWKDDELARAGIRPEAYERHRYSSIFELQYAPCEDEISGHRPATAEQLEWVDQVGQCIKCGTVEDPLNPGSWIRSFELRDRALAEEARSA